MPVLKAESDLLSNDSLQKGVVEVFITTGARELLMKLPFRRFSGTAFTFVREKTLPTTSSAVDPYGDTLPDGVGTRQRLSVEMASMARNADTAVIDVLGKSDINDQRAEDLFMSAKKMAEDFVALTIHGRHDDTNGGDYNVKGLEHWISVYETDFPNQIVYATDAGTPADYANANALSLTMLDDLLSRKKGSAEFDCIFSDRETLVAFQNLLNLAGGNVAAGFMVDKFGRSFWAYRGIPWYQLDAIGAEKTLPTTATTNADATITVSGASFYGFSKADIGRVISGTGITGGTKILSVTSQWVAEMTANATATGSITATLAADHRIYAVKFGEMDGVSAVYHANRGVPAKTSKYMGPIAGFDVEDLGKIEAAEKYRYRLSWYGNIVQQNPYAVVRLTHYTI